MATRGPDDDGSIADLPWASVFDPTSNVRALSAIQARGFRAATEVIDRLVTLSGADDPSNANEHSDSPHGGGSRDADRLVATWQNLVGQLAASIRGQAAPPHTGPTTFDLLKSDTSGHVRLTAAAGFATAEVWLHNGGSDDLGVIRLRCSDLLAHDGAVVGAARVRFEPDVVALVARSSRGVTMCVDVDDDIPRGCYRGTLLADGHTDVWLAVELVVTRAEP